MKRFPESAADERKEVRWAHHIPGHVEAQKVKNDEDSDDSNVNKAPPNVLVSSPKLIDYVEHGGRQIHLALQAEYSPVWPDYLVDGQRYQSAVLGGTEVVVLELLIRVTDVFLDSGFTVQALALYEEIDAFELEL